MRPHSYFRPRHARLTSAAASAEAERRCVCACVCVHVILMLNVGYSAGPDTSCLINHLSHQVTAGFLCSHVILALKMASNMFNFLFFLLFLQGFAVLSHVSSFMTS